MLALLARSPARLLAQIILVRGKIISVEGKVVAGSLGLADTNAAPVLMEPIGRGEGGTIKVSGDYKVNHHCVGGEGCRAVRIDSIKVSGLPGLANEPFCL